MHPEVQAAERGSCPRCGMALEPELGDLAEEGNSELRDMTTRFWTSLLFSLPLFVVAMVDMLQDALHFILLAGVFFIWGRVDLICSLQCDCWRYWQLGIGGHPQWKPASDNSNLSRVYWFEQFPCTIWLFLNWYGAY